MARPPDRAWTHPPRSTRERSSSVRVSVIGLGKLGAPLAAVIAHRGHIVIGADLNPEFVRQINDGKAPVEETGLQQMIDGCRSHLSATTDTQEAVAQTELSHVIVPTPSGPDGTFSLRHVLDAVAPIGAALREKTGFHVVALTSTVMPGHTAGKVLPALEKASGKRCGTDFGLCYNPEFIALGNVIDGLLHPDFVLIGESDPRSGTRQPRDAGRGDRLAEPRAGGPSGTTGENAPAHRGDGRDSGALLQASHVDRRGVAEPRAGAATGGSRNARVRIRSGRHGYRAGDPRGEGHLHRLRCRVCELRGRPRFGDALGRVQATGSSLGQGRGHGCRLLATPSPRALRRPGETRGVWAGFLG